ncbi:MAG TPA: RIP metalloprotease RseP [Elusimicrobiota bacterium]|nr:RIP metalloprotease RseP [Elusimicrobiota bacterium]
MSILIGILSIVFAFGLVIFVHELGHFIAAKKIGVRVDRFSFGLGPEICGFQWGETRYCLAWIPLGGEVRMAGDDTDEQQTSDQMVGKTPREFFGQPWYRRIPIVLAGPAMNYVSAVLIFTGIALMWGEPRISPEPVIGAVVPGYPAQKAGLTEKDRILSVNGQPVREWVQLAEQIHKMPEQDVTLEYQRDGADVRRVVVRPQKEKSTGVGMIGIQPDTVAVRVGLLKSLGRGVELTVGWSYFTVRYLAEKIVRREKPELSGPIGIASVVAKAAKAGAQDFWNLLGLLSVGIGLFNLFPIPMLDGGHVVFYLWEGLSRRPLRRKMLAIANSVGLSILLAILLFATVSDIRRLRAEKSAASQAQ